LKPQFFNQFCPTFSNFLDIFKIIISHLHVITTSNEKFPRPIIISECENAITSKARVKDNLLGLDPKNLERS